MRLYPTEQRAIVYLPIAQNAIGCLDQSQTLGQDIERKRQIDRNRDQQVLGGMCEAEPDGGTVAVACAFVNQAHPRHVARKPVAGLTAPISTAALDDDQLMIRDMGDHERVHASNLPIDKFNFVVDRDNDR